MHETEKQATHVHIRQLYEAMQTLQDTNKAQLTEINKLKNENSERSKSLIQANQKIRIYDLERQMRTSQQENVQLSSELNSAAKSTVILQLESKIRVLEQQVKATHFLKDKSSESERITIDLTPSTSEISETARASATKKRKAFDPMSFLATPYAPSAAAASNSDVLTDNDTNTEASAAKKAKSHTSIFVSPAQNQNSQRLAFNLKPGISSLGFFEYSDTQKALAPTENSDEQNADWFNPPQV